MPVTPGDSIYYADGTTPASLADITSAMASSVQAALNLREGHSFSWANNTEKSAQANMETGDIGYQRDNDTFYIYNGAAWKIWAKEPTAYTPTFSAFTASSSNFTYSIAGGRVFVSGKATCGTTLPNGIIRFTVPTDYNIDITSLATVPAAQIGVGGVDASTDHPLIVRVFSANIVSLAAYSYNPTLTTSPQYLQIASTSKDVPKTWASGDVFYVNFSYPVA